MAHYWPGLPSPANVNWPIRAFEINLMGTYVQGTYFALRHFMHKKNQTKQTKKPKTTKTKKKIQEIRAICCEAIIKLPGTGTSVKR